MTTTFGRSWEDGNLLEKTWYHSKWFWECPPDDFEACVDLASAHIAHDLIHRCDQMKIGITECIGRRWEQMSADRRGGWDQLHLLYAAPTAKWQASPLDDEHITKLKQTSTGALETRLINIWSSHPSSVNREGAGGECASAGTPHYVYCVIRYEDHRFAR